MKEGTFYFSHDYNTRSDEKIKRLIRKHGMLGYGIFWAIIEDLYNNANALRTDYDGIAYELRLDAEIVKSVINDFELFVFDGDFFGSVSVERRISDREKKSKKARESANYRWADANALRTQSERNAIKEKKVNKGKEIKESKGDEIGKIENPTSPLNYSDEFKVKNNPKKIQAENCEAEKQKIISDKKLMEVACMQNGITEQKFADLFQEFIKKSIAVNQTWESEKDMRTHLLNWLPKKINSKNNGTLRPTSKPVSTGGFGKL